MGDNSMERKYYEDIGYKPLVFFTVFGVSGDDLAVSREKHKVDGIPEGLQIASFTRAEQGEYIDAIIGGDIGKVLKRAESELYDKCLKAEKCVILRGSIEDGSTFDYMRNVIGIIEALVENGAVGVLDLLTFTLYSPEKWTEKFFDKEINAQNHVIIMYSKEADGYWIHTRGMSEFGRPDYGISGVPEDKLEDYKQVIDQMVFYGGQGIVFKGQAKLHTFSGKTFVVRPEFVNDFENEDYNNAYYNVTIVGEE